MCGIAGFLDPQHKLSSDKFGSLLHEMGESIQHRGPDAGDFWFEAKTGVGLSHRRLSIVDLSAAGAQPMHSHSDRYIMVFNGEIYNHLELRQELSDVAWRGHSDTETLLAGFDNWGLEETIKKTVGMFALAVWDKQEQSLFLTRDRLGEKPLYYSISNNLLIFGSELKALKAHPLYVPVIDKNSLSLYTNYSYVPTPHTIFKDTFKLEQGSFIIFDGRTLNPLIKKKYWDIKSEANKASKNRIKLSEPEAISMLEEKLSHSVKIQQLSDVPLGAFLSGGIDSSTTVALMQKTSNSQVKTFTIGFEEKRYNEATHAKVIANHLDTQHTELYTTAQEALDVIPLLSKMYDEPFSDPSQIPTYLVSKLARTKVTVSLSGDGGDELFGGYNRYLWVKKLGGYPPIARHSLAALINMLPDNILNIIPKALPFLPNVSLFADKARKLSGVINLANEIAIYQKLIQTWHPSMHLVVGLDHNNNFDFTEIDGFKLEENLMLSDASTYLADDILQKVDRASMAVSLESRVPFLDHRIVEFALGIPLDLKIRDGQTKWILRQVLYKHVPKELIERPKMGFSVPIDSWLRGPLRDWAEELLDEKYLNEIGFFNTALIRKKWSEHLSEKRNWNLQLWNILMFIDWYKAQ